MFNIAIGPALPPVYRPNDSSSSSEEEETRRGGSSFSGGPASRLVLYQTGGF